MKYKTRQKKIGFIYIAIMLMSLICNTEEKLFYERIKNFLSRKQKIVSYLQADSEYLKDAFKGFFKIGTSVSPNEFNVGSDFIKKHFNSITPENELKPDSIIKYLVVELIQLLNFVKIMEFLYVVILLFGIVKHQIGSLKRILIQVEIMYQQI